MQFKKRHFLYVLLFCFAVIFLSNVPIYKIATFPNNVLFFADDISFVNDNKVFGDYVTVSINNLNFDSDTTEPNIEFKLFNLIPIKKRKIRVLDSKKFMPVVCLWGSF